MNNTKYNVRSIWMWDGYLAKLPEWTKLQVLSDRKVGVSKYYKLIEENMSLIYKFDIFQPELLPDTPFDWNLPEKYHFSILRDVEKLMYIIGGSYCLFKFINKHEKLSWFVYKNRHDRFNRIHNSVKDLYISLTFELNYKSDLNPEENYKLVLPSIEIPYYKIMYNNNSGEDSANYFYDVYQPIMNGLGLVENNNEDISSLKQKYLSKYPHYFNSVDVKVEYS